MPGLGERLERGRWPLLISLGVSASLALITAARFLVFIAAMPATTYGQLNVFITLTNVLPFFAMVGVSLQYQRISREAGASSNRMLGRMSLMILAVTIVPVFASIFLLALPITGPYSWLPSIFTTLIASSAAYATLTSQITLGLGYRARSSLMLFMVNAASVVPMVPIAITREATLDLVLGYWAIGSVACAVGIQLFVPRRGLLPPRGEEESRVSLREGLNSVPALAGPWVLIFVVRYLVGVFLGPEALATFSISSTLAGLGFTLAAAMLGYWSNPLLTGEAHPSRIVAYTTPLLIGVTVASSVFVTWALPILGQPGYELDNLVTLLLTFIGVVRLYIMAWRQRAVGLRVLHKSAWVYWLSAGGSLLILWLLQPDQLVLYAVVLFIAYIIVAAVQRFTVRTR